MSEAINSSQRVAHDMNESVEEVEEIEVLSESQENKATNGDASDDAVTGREETYPDHENDLSWNLIEYPDRSVVKKSVVVKRPAVQESNVAKKPRSQQVVVDDEQLGIGPSQVVLPPDPVADEDDGGAVVDPSVDDLKEQVARLVREKAAVEARFEGLVSKLQAKVECPVCYDVPKKAPVYVCPNGHMVCRVCRQDNCPTCRACMSAGGTSVLALAVIENIPHSCEFQVHGCEVRCDLELLARHQTECGYRTVKCPNFSCPDKVPLAILPEHSLRRCIHNGTFYGSPLVNSYNYIIPANQEDQFDKRRNSTWRPDGLTFDGRNFFLKITRKGKKGMWYFYVQIAGSETESYGYKATIYVFKTNMGVDGRHSHRFIGDVCPVDVASTDRAAEAGYCQSLTDSQMKKVFTEGTVRENERKFGFSVEVRIEKETLWPQAVGAEPPVTEASAGEMPERDVNCLGQAEGEGQEADTGRRDGFRILRNRRPTSPVAGGSEEMFYSSPSGMSRVLLKTNRRQSRVGQQDQRDSEFSRAAGGRGSHIFKQFMDTESSSEEEEEEAAPLPRFTALAPCSGRRQ